MGEVKQASSWFCTFFLN